MTPTSTSVFIESTRKRCSKCFEIKLKSEFFVAVSSTGRSGDVTKRLSSCCLSCWHIKPSGMVSNPRLAEAKRCSRCRIVKPQDGFSIHEYTTSQGKLSIRLSSRCVACVRELDTPERKAARRIRSLDRIKSNPAEWKAYLDRKRSAQKHTPERKKCTGCGIEKLSSEFYKKSICKSGINSKCKACRIIDNDIYTHKNPEKVALWTRTAALRHKYGLEMSDYLRLCASQDNKCAICEGTPNTLAVDHCHKTGRIRGLLCNLCNLAVGNLGDSIHNAENLLSYLKERS